MEKESGYKYVKSSRNKLKQRLLYIMGDKCCICGYDKCNSALEFHHKKAEEKNFTISSNTNVSFENAKEEIKKCILVCANCHREIHSFNLDVSNYVCYDEQKAKEKEQELYDIKHRKICYCKDCGAIISSDSERCMKCNALAKRTQTRPDRDTLKELIRSTPFTQIAMLYNVTDNAIRKWCDAEQLPRTKKEINSYSDEQWKDI